MRQKNMSRFWLWLSMAGFVLLSVSFLLMTAVDVLPGVLFWAGLLLGAGGQVVMEIHRRRFFRAHEASHRNYQKPRCGICSFFSNMPAKIADTALPFCLLGFIISLIATGGFGYICYVFLAMTVLAAAMHSILNGRNYFFLKNQTRIRKVLKQRLESGKQKREESI